MGKKYFESLVHDNKTGDTVSAVLIGHLAKTQYFLHDAKSFKRLAHVKVVFTAASSM